MLNKLKAIDVAAVKRLTKLRAEQERLEGFVDKARNMKSDIDEEIFERVVDDYRQRAAALQEEAEPLKTEAREQFAILSGLLDEINEGLHDARAVKQEMEFRHKIGELDEKELADAVADAEKTLAGREKELSEAEKLEKQFRGAFESDEDLESASAPSAELGDHGATDDVDDADDADDEGDIGPDDSIREDRTIIFNEGDDATAVIEDPLKPTSEGTMLVPVGKLVQMENGKPGKEYHLGALNYLGRSPDSHVHIDAPEVSREHAIVTADVSGFVLRDLDSPNGTLVNDERVSEHPLVDGDRITIGGVDLIFHAS